MSRPPRHRAPRAPRPALLVAGFVACALGLVVWLVPGTGPGAPTPIAVGLPGPARQTPATTPTQPAASAANLGVTLKNPESSAAAAGSASAAPACATPRNCGFPGAGTTGPRTTAFTARSGDIEIRTDGQVVSGWDLSGSLDVYADDVTVIDSRIDSRNWWAVNLRPGFTGLRVLHSELTATPGAGPDSGGEDYAVSDMGEGAVEVGLDDVSVFADALSMGHGYIHEDYVHDIVPFVNRSSGYAHLDAVLSDGDDTLGLRVVHNTLLNPAPVNQGTISVIGLLPDTGPVSDTTIGDNRLAGGAYAVYGGGRGSTGVVDRERLLHEVRGLVRVLRPDRLLEPGRPGQSVVGQPVEHRSAGAVRSPGMTTRRCANRCERPHPGGGARPRKGRE